jgi:hypothetical protein
MRLVDADKLIEVLNNMPYIKGRYDNANANEHFIFGCETVYEIVINMLENQPTAYDVDKVVRKLDLLIMDEECKLIGSSKHAFKETLKKRECYKNAREIVKAGELDG